MKILQCPCGEDVEVRDTVLYELCAECASYYECPVCKCPVLTHVEEGLRYCDACEILNGMKILVQPTPVWTPKDSAALQRHLQVGIDPTRQ